MGEIGPYRGPALAKYKHMMQHTYGYNSSTGYQSNEHYPSGRHSLGPHLGRRVAHELAMMYDGDNVAMRRPQSSFDAPYSKYLFLSFIIEFFILKVEHKLQAFNMIHLIQ
uniref:Bm12260 n=2 Tax=Brugia malayi TaxID=6279 RepID=A0A1I9GAW7_BRUMA|nr:Bm12260 [Brugia malayi]